MFRLDLTIGILCGILIRSVLFEGFFYLLRRIFRENNRDLTLQTIRQNLTFSPLGLVTESNEESLIELLNQPKDLFSSQYLSDVYPETLKLWILALKKQNQSIDPDQLVTRAFRLQELHQVFFIGSNEVISISGSSIRFIVYLLGVHCPIPQFKIILFGLANFLNILG